MRKRVDSLFENFDSEKSSQVQYVYCSRIPSLRVPAVGNSQISTRSFGGQSGRPGVCKSTELGHL